MKILNKLTLKSLKLNKSRTIVTIIGILLSTALITVVAGIASSGQQTMINAEINFDGDYELQLSGNVDSEDIKEIGANRNVKAVYFSDSAGLAKIPAQKADAKPFAYINALSVYAYTDCFDLPLESGSYPKNSSELVITQDFIANSEKNYKVGDTITLGIGERKTTDGTPISYYEEYGKIHKETENGYETIDIEETFDVQSNRTYKIVGILDNYSSRLFDTSDYRAISPVFTVCDTNSLTDEAQLFIKFTDDGCKNYIQTTSQITGLSEEHIKGYLAGECEIKSGDMKYEYMHIHTTLLSYMGYALSDQSLTMFYSLAGIIITIVIFASIFVIRNSFAISITEKTKLYGMLSSVGTTSRQIRHNVLFEGFILALIGIPLGILLGVGVVAILIQIINLLLADMLNGIDFAYSVPVVAIVLAVALSMLTILFSTLGSAFRASRISPIDAVRGNNDIKLKKKPKSYRCPKFIKKLFGTGGEIAYKNLKRSKKKYRTTVISIVVSVAIFIAVSSFVQYGIGYSSNYYYEMDYNMWVGDNGFDSFDDMSSAYSELSKLDGVKSSRLLISAGGYLKSSEKLNSVLSEDAKIYTEESSDDSVYYIQLFAFDDETYKAKLKELGLNYDDVNGKAILVNCFEYTGDDNKPHNAELFDSDKVESLTIRSDSDPAYEGYYKPFEVEIAKTYNTVPETFDHIIPSENNVYLIVNSDILKNHYEIDHLSSNLFIDAEDPDKLEKTIEDHGGSTLFDVTNLEKLQNLYNSMNLVICIFAYGFIIVISLIGVTNIFNTITTNMRLRSKEFAMLKSIGMTKREFNRMIRLESLFYGIKSLIIGIPLGLLAEYAIFKAFSANFAIELFIPYSAILISIVFVFAVVWLIMRFSISKVQKQNIIETIRNDNI